MTIVLTALRNGRGFLSNDKEMVYTVAFGAEPYVTGGIELNSEDHFVNDDDNRLFESIDYAEVINPSDIDNTAVYNALEDNVDTSNPKVNVQRSNFAGAQTPNATLLTESFKLKVVGVPFGAPGGVNR